MSENDVQQATEIRQIQDMLESWHKLKMEHEIDDEIEQKKLRDKIRSFAEKKTKITTTSAVPGEPHGSSVKAVSKKGT